MSEVFVLLWEDRDSSSLCGIFASPTEAYDHLVKEAAKLAKRFEANVVTWKNVATKTTGNDAKHALFMANLAQDEINAGLVEIKDEQKRSTYTYGGMPKNAITLYRCCEEYFSIINWEIGTGRILF